MIVITKDAVDPKTMYERIGKSEAGSILLHYAVVKGQAGERASAGIHFERAGEVESELSAIEADIKERWNVEDVLLVRRIDTLEIGDVISLIAVSSPTSQDAFDACRHGLERMKRMKTLKKTERLVSREGS